MQRTNESLPREPGVPSLGHEIAGLMHLALPIIATMLSRTAMGFIDFAMVSTLGTEATAAISPAVIFVFTVQCLGMGAATSIQTFASQALGRGTPREGAGYAAHGFYIAAIFGLLAYPVIRTARPFWAAMGNEPAVMEQEIAYCEICLWSMPFAVICSALDGFFQGVKRPGVPLVSILVSLVVNATGNYVLIFGKFGAPEMGISGAALATVIGWAVRAGMLSAIFLSREFRRDFGSHEGWRFDAAKFAGLIRVGGPIALQWLLDIGSWFVFLTLMMGAFGTATQAAANTGIQLMHVSFMPAIGIGYALTSLAGHAIGEGRPGLAMLRARACMILTGGYMGAIGLVFWLGRRALVDLFTDDAEVIALGAGVMIWAAVFQVFDAMCITFSCALRGAGDTKWPAVAVALHCWVIFVGGGYLMTKVAPSWGYHGPWMTCTLYIILLGLVLWRRWAGGAWRRIELFKPRTAPEDSVAPVPAIDGVGIAPTLAEAEARPCK